MIAAPLAWAGGKDGGGGFAIVCPSVAPFKSPIVVDLYEYFYDLGHGKQTFYNVTGPFNFTPSTGDDATDEQLLDTELNQILNQKLMSYPGMTTFHNILK